jgi:hypothetical protein
MKRLIAMILCLATLCLAGCKKAPAPAPAGQKTDDLSGTWVAEIDLSSYLKERIVEVNDELKETLKISPCLAKVTLKIDADGTYHRTIEGVFDEAAVTALRTELLDGYTAYYTKYLKDNDLDMSVAEFEKTTGISLAAKAEQVADADYLSGIIRDMDKEGKYLIENGVIYLNGFVSAEEKTFGHKYKKEEGKLTLAECTDPTAFEDAFYPLTFEKAD